jgi:DNA-binding NarL/FixJ family response regulator
MTITVMIVDDQPLMRSALRTCLETEPDLTVIGEATDGAEAVRMARRLRPAVIVMDVRMPIMDGIEATRQIVAQAEETPPRVLVMTTYDIDEYIIDALRAGASGFLVKDAPAEEVVHAVRVLADGQALLAPSVTRRLLDLRGRTLHPLPSEARNPALATITAREFTVLKLVARGLSNTDIAREMKLAASSVKTHVGHLLAKLKFTDRVQLVVFAYEHELVRPGSADPDPDPAEGPGGPGSPYGRIQPHPYRDGRV